mmetsp:Transcript_51520/g.122516  ORF Transcript_51520/g.122516 Transcript_51520/m.122516 type:complete len:652 (+) Transcript_51520:115-2070(+)
MPSPFSSGPEKPRAGIQQGAKTQQNSIHAKRRGVALTKPPIVRDLRTGPPRAQSVSDGGCLAPQRRNFQPRQRPRAASAGMAVPEQTVCDDEDAALLPTESTLQLPGEEVDGAFNQALHSASAAEPSQVTSETQTASEMGKDVSKALQCVSDQTAGDGGRHGSEQGVQANSVEAPALVAPSDEDMAASIATTQVLEQQQEGARPLSASVEQQRPETGSTELSASARGLQRGHSAPTLRNDSTAVSSFPAHSRAQAKAAVQRTARGNRITPFTPAKKVLLIGNSSDSFKAALFAAENDATKVDCHAGAMHPVLDLDVEGATAAGTASGHEQWPELSPQAYTAFSGHELCAREGRAFSKLIPSDPAVNGQEETRGALPSTPGNFHGAGQRSEILHSRSVPPCRRTWDPADSSRMESGLVTSAHRRSSSTVGFRSIAPEQSATETGTQGRRVRRPVQRDAAATAARTASEPPAGVISSETAVAAVRSQRRHSLEKQQQDQALSVIHPESCPEQQQADISTSSLYDSSGLRHGKKRQGPLPMTPEPERTNLYFNQEVLRYSRPAGPKRGPREGSAAAIVGSHGTASGWPLKADSPVTFATRRSHQQLHRRTDSSNMAASLRSPCVSDPALKASRRGGTGANFNRSSVQTCFQWDV